MNESPNVTVRTFRAPSPRAALEAVKAALGVEAVILETREVRGRFLGRTEIEITAASPADPTLAPLQVNERVAPEPRGTTPRPGPEIDSEVVALRRVVEDMRRELSRPRAEPRDLAEPRQAAEPRQLAEPRDLAEVGGAIPPDAMRLYRRLVQRGVDPTAAETLTRHALRDAASSRTPELLEAVRALLRRRLASALPPWDSDERKIIAFVGPTGVGKTTTLAKIAARALLERRLKVALVTVDTYRIGASEHISRYGEIMGVAVHVARDAAGLRKAMTATADARLVLIDTAGRSDAEALGAQSRLLQNVPALETHLVLSAASGPREIAAAARRYRHYDVDRFIFTKLDEADGPGAVLAATDVVTAPVSCLTDGQRVPDDLHAATGPRLAELVLGK